MASDVQQPPAAIVTEMGAGVLRITHPLPWALDHVHCYALTGPDGWTIVDAGLGTRGTVERWREVIERLGAPRIRQLVVTHYHPDHLGCMAALAELTGAEEVVQGALDARLARIAWVETESAVFEEFLRSQGMPGELAAASASAEARIQVELPAPTRLVGEGDSVQAGGTAFEIVHLPGHADGHIVLLDRSAGRMFGGDVILDPITPNIGRWEDTAPDPLGRYLATLDRLEELALSVVYPGHREPIVDVPRRARQLRAHHQERLDVALGALGDETLTTYEVVQRLWSTDGFSLHEQRFALVEALAHLEHLAARGEAIETEPGRWISAG